MRRVLQFAAVVAWAVCAWLLVDTAVAVARYEQPLPLLDHWATVRAMLRIEEGSYGLAGWFEPHNEHRIPVARLLHYVDFRWLGMTGHLQLLVSFALQAATAAALALLARELLRGATSSAAAAWALAGVVTAWMFAGVQIANLIEPFQVTFVLVYAAMTVSFAALARARHASRGRRWFWLAVVAAQLSTWGMANGVLVWPLLAAQSAALRLPRRATATIAVLGALSIASYLLGYETPKHHASPWESLRHPLAVLHYTTCTLGNPLRGPDSTPDFAFTAAAGGLGLAGLLALLWRWRRRDASPAHAARLALLAIALFAVGSAALAALGRANFGLGSSMASRYATPALLFWSALLLLLAHGRHLAMRLTAAAVGATVLLLVAWQQDAATDRGTALRVQMRHATTASLCSVHDVDVMKEPVSPSPDYVLTDLVPLLRDRGCSVFANGVHRALGRPLAEVVGTREVATVRGGVQTATFVADTGWGFRVDGVLALDEDVDLPRHGFLVDDDDTVLGILMPDPRPAPQRQQRFVGHAVARGPSSSVQAVVPLEGGRLLRAAARRELRGAAFATGDGAAIPGLGLQVLGEFGPPTAERRPDERLPPANDAAPVLATTGAGRGAATFEPIAAGTALAIAVCTGELSLGTGVLITDARTRAPLQTLHPAPTLGRWHKARLAPLPAGTEGAAVLVVDLGARAGQWLAVTPPIALRE